MAKSNTYTKNVAAVLVHPDLKKVLRIAVEPISVEARGKALATLTEWLDHLQINAAYPELEVTIIQYTEVTSDQEVSMRFSWVTQLRIDASNVAKLAVGGRTRWKIENETFNTLKNQGYRRSDQDVRNEESVLASYTLLLRNTLADNVAGTLRSNHRTQDSQYADAVELRLVEGTSGTDFGCKRDVKT